MSTVSNDDIEHALASAGISGYTGTHIALGGGEINDTFKLELEDRSIILRVSKYPDQDTLKNEARSLRLLNIDRVPKLLFYDSTQTIHDRKWILEAFIEGQSVKQLTVAQYENFGSLLAEVHQSQTKQKTIDVWSVLISNTKSFGDEAYHLAHPDPRLSSLVQKMQEYCADWQAAFAAIPSVIIHGDATPSNVLVDGDNVSLIDWEMSDFHDPLMEFSTIYYDDMEFNQGKWRKHITAEEKAALFAGYKSAGGTIDEDRIRFWMNHDKLGAALFLYWRINQSGRPATPKQMEQYQLDLNNLAASLERNLP